MEAIGEELVSNLLGVNCNKINFYFNQSVFLKFNWLHVNIPKVRYSDMGNKAE